MYWSVFAVLVSVSLVLGFLLFLRGLPPTSIEVPYTMTIEVIDSTHYLIAYDLYFKMSEDKLSQCPVLENAVLTLLSEQKTELHLEVMQNEFDCIANLFTSEAMRPDISTFYYQERYFTVGFSID